MVFKNYIRIYDVALTLLLQFVKEENEKK